MYLPVFCALIALALSACAGSGDMVRVPAGLFSMGYEIDNRNEWGDVDEEPVHEVYLDAYSIDKYETTSREFAEFLNADPDESERYIKLGKRVTVEKADGKFRARAGLENYPVNRVTWHGANAYCRWKGKRLPTEAEWEKAARGEDGRTFPWGEEHPDDSLATYRREIGEFGFKAMEPVDSLPEGRSPYGLHHMAGNAWEWVADWFDDDYYAHSPKANPKGPDSGTTKVLRGGNWYYKAYYMRSAYRFNDKPEATKIWQGFRCSGDAPEGR